MKIKVFYTCEPVIETRTESNVLYGLHRDRCPDNGWGEYRWTTMSNEALTEVELTPELTKTLIEDICQLYDGDKAFQKLKEFDLIKFPTVRKNFTKEEAIKNFIEGCLMHPDKRSFAVVNQYNRCLWDIESGVGLIRILDLTSSYKIIIYPYLPNDQFESDLSKDEYDHLKSIYFGEFIPDSEYLKKLNTL